MLQSQSIGFNVIGQRDDVIVMSIGSFEKETRKTHEKHEKHGKHKNTQYI